MNRDPHAGVPVVHTGTPLARARLALVMLHGRGTSAEDILGLARYLHREGVAFLAPQAAGYTWYPHSFLAPADENEPWVTSAHGAIEATLATCAEAGLGADRCGLIGFSQGACLATDHVARFPRRYGLVGALTGGLIGPPGTAFEFDGDLGGTPAFMGANDPDPHVPWARVEESASVLRAMGAEVVLQRYPGEPHSVNADEIDQIGALIDAALSASA